MVYLFLLLSAPPAPACILWMDHRPVANDYMPPVCPIAIMPNWDWYTLRAISWNGEILCEWAANISLSDPPCALSPSNNYHFEVWLNTMISVCRVKILDQTLTSQDIAEQCPEWLDEYQAGELEIRGPIEIKPPKPVPSACMLPSADNSAPLATLNNYEFLTSRLAWWGIDISPMDWQNRFDEQIRGASDTAGVPAALLKAMLAHESQFWPLWTGDAGEVGWMQITWDGTDTALRHDPELFTRYCQRAIWPEYCTGYDLLTDDQRHRVRSVLVADLSVSGTPPEAAMKAADDLWIYAHILRAYACQATQIFPNQDVWLAAAVLYNAGVACIKEGVICPQGEAYLKEVLNERYNRIHPPGRNPGRDRHISFDLALTGKDI